MDPVGEFSHMGQDILVGDNGDTLKSFAVEATIKAVSVNSPWNLKKRAVLWFYLLNLS